MLPIVTYGDFMAKQKTLLTDAAIRKFGLPKTGQAEHFDAALPGFAIRITPRGTRSFVFFYRIYGKQRRRTLGRYPGIGLSEARQRASDILEQLELGHDPDHVRLERKADGEAARQDTYASAVEDYIQKYAIAKKANRSWKDQRAMLLNANKDWHDRPVASITRAELYDVLDSRMAAGKPYMANRTYETLRTLFRWLYKRDRVPENLMDKVEKPFDGESRSKRSWKDKEIVELWKAADTQDAFWSAYLKLLILLGQRRNELSGLCWSELDLKKKVWTLPLERHKGKRGHIFPLPALAVRILKGIPRVEGSPFVFPSRVGAPMTVGSKAQARIQTASGVKDFNYKTARHTFRTGLDKLKVPPHVKLECLGHARQGVGDIHYSHYDYLDEQREAFEAWAGHVEKLVYPEGVVGLHG